MPARKSKPGKHARQRARGTVSTNPSSTGIRRNVMVNPDFGSFKTNHLLVAPVYRTTVGCCLAGTFPAATLARGWFCVSGNSAHIPFASTLAAANQTVNTYSFTGYASETYNTVQPQGWAAIIGSAQLYRSYRVIKSRIRANFNPQSTVDNQYVVITPVCTGMNPNTQIWTAQEAPFATKPRIFTTFQSTGGVIKELTTAEVWGTTSMAVQSESNYAATYNTSPVNEWCWVINWQQANNTTTNSVMPVQIVVEYDIEFFNIQTGGLPDTFASSSSSTDASTTDIESGWKPEVCDDIDKCVPIIDGTTLAALSTQELLIRQTLLRREREEREKACAIYDGQVASLRAKSRD